MDASKKVSEEDLNFEEECKHTEQTGHQGALEQGRILLGKVGQPEKMEDQSLR